ncbi:MAG: transketolase family protein [Treponema sp.]|nr:transketolase family protein [Treponema sp.]
MEKVLANLRRAYGEALAELGGEYQGIVALEADLGKSTMSCLFKDAFPDRYFEMGIAEQNMASVAAGLALCGKIPFYSSFAVFASGRAYDQIRCSIAIPRVNVRICGSSCGLSDFGDGKTHQSVEDANIMAAMPNMTVLNPADAVEVKKMMRALAVYRGPAYIRIHRGDLPVVTPEPGEYQIGKIYPITRGGDVAVFATGVMVGKALEAAEKLKGEGIDVQVLNVSTLKPLPGDEVLRYTRGKRAIVTAEEAVRSGGLGSAVASLLCGLIQVPFRQLAINDEFGRSARSYDELLEKYGLSAGDICRAIKEALNAP